MSTDDNAAEGGRACKGWERVDEPPHAHLTTFAPATVFAGIAAPFEGQGFTALRAEDAFSRDFLFRSRTNRRLFDRRRVTTGNGCRLLQFLLHFVKHIEEGIADCHGAARTAAGIAACYPAYRIGRAVPRRIELVNDGINIDAGPGTDGNHTRQADHEVVAAARRAFTQIRFQKSPGLGVKEGHAVQAAAARDELALLADDVVVDADDFTTFQSNPCRRYLLFFFMGRQDAGPFAAVTE